jgi:hypothetical protein
MLTASPLLSSIKGESVRRVDFFTKAQNFIHKLKHLLFDIALLVVFVVWLWEKVKHEFR